MSHLEKHVMLPMEELTQRLSFRFELTKEVYNAQLMVLGGNSSKGWKGLLGEVQAARVRHAKQMERLKSIREIFEHQRELSACILTQALALKSKVSQNCHSILLNDHAWKVSVEEERFFHDLDDIRLQVASIESSVEALRQKSRAWKLSQAKMRTPGVATPHAHLIVSPEKSPIKQVEWFSRRRIAAQARPAENPSFIASTPLCTPAKEQSLKKTRMTSDQVTQITQQLRSQVCIKI